MNETVTLKDPKTMLTSTGWTYQTLVQGAASTFNYRVTIYRDGREIAASYADTKWGARREAKKLQRRYHRRLKLTGETRVLR